MKDCKHVRIDTNTLYKTWAGTCNDCRKRVEAITIPLELYEKLLEIEKTYRRELK